MYRWCNHTILSPVLQSEGCLGSSVSSIGTCPVRRVWKQPVGLWSSGRWVWRRVSAGPWPRPSRPTLTRWTSPIQTRQLPSSTHGSRTTLQVPTPTPLTTWILQRASLPTPSTFALLLSLKSFVTSVVSSSTAAIPEFLVRGSLTDETRLVLLNALHFQALWKVPFDPKMTQERMFHCANGSSVPVHMMRLTNRFHYGNFQRTDPMHIFCYIPGNMRVTDKKTYISLILRRVCDSWGYRLRCHWGPIWGRLTEHAPCVTHRIWSSFEQTQRRTKQPENSSVESRAEERQETAGHAQVRKKDSDSSCYQLILAYDSYIRINVLFLDQV